MSVELHLNRSGLIALKEQLDNPREILEMIGLTLVSHTEKAFEDEEWDGERWPERYMFQGDYADSPFINIAGMISDLTRGAGIKPHRFDQRPVLQDTGQLVGSFQDANAIEVDGYSVEVGTTVPHASIQMFGGDSEQPITMEVRQGVWEFVTSPEGAPFFAKLQFLLTDDYDVHVTNVMGRQFLGITDLIASDIRDIVEQSFHWEETEGENGGR